MKNQDFTNNNKQILLFTVLTYSLSWTFMLTGSSMKVMPVILLGVWTPSLVAISLTAYFYGRKGLAQFLGRFRRVKVAWYYWLALLFLPALIHYAGVALWQVISAGKVSGNIVLPTQYWLGAIIPSFLIAGLGEELGWRGFLLPRLQKKMRPLKATLLLAIIHFLWHLPTYWLGTGMHNVPTIFAIGFLFPWTVIFVWLYNKSQGSLIFAVGFHAISNASLSIVSFMPPERVVPITPQLITQTSLPANLAGPYLTVVAVYIVAVALILIFGKFKQVHIETP